MNRNAWVSRGQASYLTGVSADAIGKWNARGWVDATGARRRLKTRRLPSGRLQYRLGDILDAERDTHLSGKGHRNRASHHDDDDWQLVAA
ncbi:MAG: hypothetical protein K0R37_2061 [Arthrobacter sp.]|jgi:hypothetical protein|nr:hypothetical protein [Arthrobacter sp.]